MPMVKYIALFTYAINPIVNPANDQIILLSLHYSDTECRVLNLADKSLGKGNNEFHSWDRYFAPD